MGNVSGFCDLHGTNVYEDLAGRYKVNGVLLHEYTNKSRLTERVILQSLTSNFTSCQTSFDVRRGTGTSRLRLHDLAHDGASR